MSTDYTGTAGTTLITSITEPTDGDPGTAASVNNVFEPYADNFATLNSWFSLTSGSGNPRSLPIVTSASSLRSRSATDGDVVLLMSAADSSGRPIGIFRYVASDSTTAESETWVYTPNSGVGRWHSIYSDRVTRPGYGSQSLLAPAGTGQATRIATTDDSGYLACPTKFGLVNAPAFNSAYTLKNFGSSVVQYETTSLYYDTQPSDVWVVDCQVYVSNITGSSCGIVTSISMEAGGSGYGGSGEVVATLLTGSGTTLTVSYSGAPYSAIAAGYTADIKCLVVSTVQSSSISVKVLNFRVAHYRG